MTKTELAAAIGLVDAARARAFKIGDGAPFWLHVSEPAWSRLEIEGDEAVLRNCRATTDYDCPVLDTDEVRFPVALLFVSDDELAAWKDEQDRLYDQKQRERAAQVQAVATLQERQTLALLKAKYPDA